MAAELMDLGQPLAFSGSLRRSRAEVATALYEQLALVEVPASKAAVELYSVRHPEADADLCPLARICKC